MPEIFHQLKNIFWMSCLAVVLLQGCNAPRNNPLDPNNPDNQYVSLEGTVRTFSVPRELLPDVTVRWKNEEMTVMTDASGTFQFEQLQPDDGYLIFEKNGYHRDSLFVEWGKLKKITVQPLLNAVTRLDSLLIYSIVKNRFPFIQDYEIALQAKVSDPDNDIDSVFWGVPDLNLEGIMKYNLDTEIYEINFETSDYGLGSEAVLGHDFVIMVLNKFGKRFQVGSDLVKRVIKEEVTLTSPTNGQVADSKPLLEWQPFTPGFSFHFNIEIFLYVLGEPLELIWEKQGVSSDAKNYQVDVDLPAGSFKWNIWVVDEFGNRSRSKYNSFEVR